MTLAELQIARGHLIDRALRTNSEDDWYDLESVEHEIERRQEQRLADARLVETHERFHGSQPDDVQLLADVDEPFGGVSPWGDPLPPNDEAR